MHAAQSFLKSRLKRLTHYMGLSHTGFDGFVEWVLTLREQVNIPHTLADIDINDEQAELVGKMAVEDPSAGGNPIELTAQQYQQIFVNAVRGQL